MVGNDKEEFRCNFCNKLLKTKYTLKRHKEQSKICLRLRVEAEASHLARPGEPKRLFKTRCMGCDKEFTRVGVLKVHQERCIPFHVSKAVLSVELDLREQHENELQQVQDLHDLKVKKLTEVHELKIAKLVAGNEDLHDRMKKLLNRAEAKRKKDVTETQKLLDAEKNLHAVTLGKLELQTETVHKAVEAPRTTVNNTTNNANFYLANFTQDVGNLLADNITQEEFWGGQRQIAKKFKSLKDNSGNSFYRVKDENRGKFEISMNGELTRDDRAEKMIQSVKEPVKAKIVVIRDDLYSRAQDAGDGQRVNEQAMKCLQFSDSATNRQFVLELASKGA